MYTEEQVKLLMESAKQQGIKQGKIDLMLEVMNQWNAVSQTTRTYEEQCKTFRSSLNAMAMVIK